LCATETFTAATTKQQQTLTIKKTKHLSDPMMAAMSTLMTQMSSAIIAATRSIGKLADSIVGLEKLINNLGLEIGHVADCIVDTEALGIALFARFCSAFHPPSPPLPPPFWNGTCSFRKEQLLEQQLQAVAAAARAASADVAAARAQSARAEWHIVNLTRRQQQALLSLSWDPMKDMAAMIALCGKFMKMLATMASSMGSVAASVLQGVGDMSSRIVQTVGLIGQQALNMGTMAKQVASVQRSVQQLMQDCTSYPRHHITD
jgi:hypothetical protein